MKRLKILFQMRWLAFALIALTLVGGRVEAAASPAETRAWDAACRAFDDAKGASMRILASQKFTDFMKRYPDSDHYDEAVVFRARLLFDQGSYDATIDLLSSQASRASNSADQFAYWTARAYAQKKNYEAAADAYAKLVRENTNSTLRVEALFREAEAHAKLEYWPRVIEELGETNGAFQQVALTNRSDELVVNGLLLLGEAQLAQKEYEAAEKTLSGVAAEHLPQELEWDRQALLCRVLLESGRETNALNGITNLLAAAVAAAKPELKAKTFALKGEIYEALRRFPDASDAYAQNLDSDVPLVRRQALLNIVELALRQGDISGAAQKLKDFLARHPDEKGADLNRLVLGELELRQYYQGTNTPPAAVAGTNLLQSAQTEFETLIKVFTNSDYLGKAELNLGWCLLGEDRIAESQAAFSNAVAHLPFSEDQAVARFKLGDLLYQQHDLAGALEQYTGIITKYESLPGVRNDLLELALYKTVVIGIEDNNLKTAGDAMDKIIALFPTGDLTQRSLLQLGQARNAPDARDTFASFVARFPQSGLLPEVKLALARTYEREGDWRDAITQYNAWVQTYTNHPGLARAEFSRAWATYKAGDETNAFTLMTNFVARFSTNAGADGNDLAARAQFWVGDYYWRQGDFQKAESKYEELFESKKWPESDLTFQARMMAGRAALQRDSPPTAIQYFTNLASIPNCPSNLVAQAQFAIGDATWRLASGADTTKNTNYSDAMRSFLYIANTYTNSEIASQAWGKLGSCYFALALNDPSQYAAASNAFNKAMTSERADVTTRSMAEVGLGLALERMAALAPEAGRKEMFIAALGHFINVVHGENLREGESADLFWVKEAGLKAASLAEDLGEWRQAIEFYESLKKAVPPEQAGLDKKIARAQEKLAQQKN